MRKEGKGGGKKAVWVQVEIQPKDLKAVTRHLSPLEPAVQRLLRRGVKAEVYFADNEEVVEFWGRRGEVGESVVSGGSRNKIARWRTANQAPRLSVVVPVKIPVWALKIGEGERGE